ncbi:MAG: undecaprenyl-diphosphate phosphatase [Anaerolineae bacterium]|nr:undecaprenyl-diphosphate phosphatase [Thermoflexales bacterium]MDW8408117.1 undecaprenyl-diphosphate phosphatase [Anaerolineae bacterium]
MDMLLLLKALVMGIVEGVTEFLPISSTGHLIVAGRILHLPANMRFTFEIFIQLGAILAVIVYFARDLIGLGRDALADNPNTPAARRLLLGVAVAFAPAGLIGFLFNDLIDAYLFHPFTVGVALIVGAIVILAIERRPCSPITHAVAEVRVSQALLIGASQVASLFPGFSRSAATIVGGLLAGLDRPTALRFSFYLSIPTMVIATVYALAKNVSRIQADQLPAFGVGLIASFGVALIVVHWFLKFVSTHTLKPFAWYRLAAGAVIIVLSLAGAL